MLELREDAGELSLRGDEYELLLRHDEPACARLSVRNRPAVDLAVASVCDADGERDRCEIVGPPRVGRDADGITVEIPARSKLWGEVAYVFRASPDALEHFARRRGRREIDDLSLCSGRNELSRPYWTAVFDPEPNARRKHHFVPGEFATIGVSSDKTYYRGNWFFTPGPLCYAFHLGEGIGLAAGIAARPGENNFDHFEYRGEAGGFGFNLRYGGHTDSPEEWESPHLVFLVADDDFAAVAAYCDWLRAAGLVPAANDAPQAGWWHEPIFCGWGEQVALEGRTTLDRPAPVLAADLCTEANYRRFLATLERHELSPGTIVLDDKWQSRYGLNDPDPAKWPDLPGFVAEQRAAGRRVLLWLRAWSPQGVPAGECLARADGALAVDPSSPAYEARLRRQVHNMLMVVGADGFKIDFTHCLPVAPGLRTVGGLWGLELLRRLLWIIRDEAKRAKPDAMIMAHTANPYFADLVDVLRLNDVANVPGEPGFLGSMEVRARVARLASRQWLIDTDNWPSPNRDAWLEYCRVQPALGIPSLYYASRVYHLSETGEVTDQPLLPADYAEIAALWSAYRSTLVAFEC